MVEDIGYKHMGQDMLMRRDDDSAEQFRVTLLDMKQKGTPVHGLGANHLDTALG
jgi:hypothetical protein